ncbi:MAG: hypothetical protein P9M08_08610 [Candidatus Erginobacter occultus]|nr:hypothetical protein [Candidatus Erginobacter occultus]
MKRAEKMTVGLLIVLLLLTIAGCAAGPDSRFAACPAGFWPGLWHGLISPVTFVVGLFSRAVRIYETNNTGNWYDFGFMIGVGIIFGGGLKAGWGIKSRSEKEWDEIGEKVERKIRRGIADWLNEEKKEDDGEWREISGRIEEKIKRELRDWADK